MLSLVFPNLRVGAWHLHRGLGNDSGGNGHRRSNSRSHGAASATSAAFGIGNGPKMSLESIIYYIDLFSKT